HTQMDPKPVTQPDTDVIKAMWIAVADITQPICIPLEAAIVGTEMDLYVYRKDIVELLQKQEICVSIVQVFN
ncbi:Unknown protein, partial [Striga hermonthica]